MRRFCRCVCACALWFAPGYAAVELGSADSFPVSFAQDATAKPLAVRLARISKDATLDAIVSSSGSAAAYYACLGGNGDGTFGAAVASGLLRSDAVDLVVGDFNGDGIVDFAAANKSPCG